jgi:hypothetical protein
VGAGTLHNSAESIAKFNGTYDSKYDGYIAIADCNYGDEYYLLFYGKIYFVAVSDCLNPKDRQATLSKRYAKNGKFLSENPKGIYHWIVDIDKNIWAENPKIPTIVILIKKGKEKKWH